VSDLNKGFKIRAIAAIWGSNIEILDIYVTTTITADRNIPQYQRPQHDNHFKTQFSTFKPDTYHDKINTKYQIKTSSAITIH